MSCWKRADFLVKHISPGHLISFARRDQIDLQTAELIVNMTDSFNRYHVDTVFFNRTIFPWDVLLVLSIENTIFGDGSEFYKITALHELLGRISTSFITKSIFLKVH